MTLSKFCLHTDTDTDTHTHTHTHTLTLANLHLSAVLDLLEQFLRAACFVEHKPLQMKDQHGRETGQTEPLVGLRLCVCVWV